MVHVSPEQDQLGLFLLSEEILVFGGSPGGFLSIWRLRRQGEELAAVGTRAGSLRPKGKPCYSPFCQLYQGPCSRVLPMRESQFWSPALAVPCSFGTFSRTSGKQAHCPPPFLLLYPVQGPRHLGGPISVTFLGASKTSDVTT